MQQGILLPMSDLSDSCCGEHEQNSDSGKTSLQSNIINVFVFLVRDKYSNLVSAMLEFPLPVWWTSMALAWQDPANIGVFVIAFLCCLETEK